METTNRNRLQPVFIGFYHFSSNEKTATVVFKKPVAVQLQDRFFPVAATGLRNTTYSFAVDKIM
jgi:hypothetical protein